MLLFLAHLAWVMPWGDRLRVFIPIIVSATGLGLVIFPVARKYYRERRQQWLPARLVWVLFGAGIELLAGGMVADGIYGLLGFEGLSANIFLAIAIACGAMGILLNVVATVFAVISRIRYESYTSDQKDHEDG